MPIRQDEVVTGEGDFLFLLLKMLDSESHSLDFNTRKTASIAVSLACICRRMRLL